MSAAPAQPAADPRFVTWVTSGSRFEVDPNYRFVKLLGQGAYGVVVAAKDTTTGKDVAIKKIAKSFEHLTDAKRTLREIKLCRHFHHENIISLEKVLRPRSLREFEDVYLITELMDTDLYQIIKSPQDLGDDHVQYFLYQILRGLKYIHSANVLHRDLKPSNLLVNANCDLKICDFGLARVSNPDDHDKFMTEYVATRWYRPPEVILSWKEYGKAIDMWAVGCIFAELLGRKPLFPGSDYLNQLSLISNVLGTPSQEDIEKIGSAKARDYVLKMPFRKKVPFSKLYPKASTAAIDLLERMLTFDPDKRITVNEALAHPYLASLHDPNDEPTCPQVFDFQFEAQPLGRRDVRALIFEEICNYYPDLRKEENLRQEAEQKNAAARAAAHEPEPEPPAKPIKPEDQPIF